MKRRFQLAVLILTASLAVPVLAQQTRIAREGNAWVEETAGTLPQTGTLSITLDLGNVAVKGGGQQSITYIVRKRAYFASEADARRAFQAYQISTSRQGDVTMIRGASQHDVRHMTADVTVQVPRGMELIKARTEGGNEAISGLDGRVEAVTGGGSVNLDDISGAISASSGGGNIQVGNVGSDVLLKTGGGNINVGSAKGRIITYSGGGNIGIGSGSQNMTVETGGGAIDVKHCGGELNAQTGGGRLQLGQVMGRAKLQSGGGSIRLASANGPVVAETAGGRVELFNLSQGARVETGGGGITAEFLAGQGFSGSTLQTPAGDIVVYLDSGLKATIKASVDVGNGHTIRSEFPEVHVSTEGGQWGPKSYYADGSLNGGGPVLRLHTTTGSIDIRRAKK